MHPLDELKKQIKTQLDLCESQDTPTVCAIKEDPDGYRELEKIIIDKVMYSDDNSIANAIVEIENEFNANSYGQ